MIYIQILRGIAASIVVIYHSIGTAHHYVPDEESIILQIFNYGSCGVDLFFVIYGFIIYHSTHASSVSPKSFLARRIKRIVPIYWLSTALMIGITVVSPASFRNEGHFSASHFIESLFFVTFSSGRMPIVYVGWSLEFEMFFYLIVALLLCRPENAWNRLIYAFSFLVVAHLAPLGDTFQVIGGFFTSPKILEFVYGVMAAQMFHHGRLSNGAIASAAVATLAIAATDRQSYVLWAGLPAAIGVFLAAKRSIGVDSPSRMEKFGAQIGDASYSIYLFQVFMISGACKAIFRLHPSIDVLIVVTAVSSIFGGWLFFILLEKPLLMRLRHFGERRAAPMKARELRANS
ncbi:acyltransferase [Methylosinus sp. Ce-a6]|uniref:acyltransferase family protein n=1 Tax=Methylosinus sp. Ce-a6 TaxID=2172005 RepID=UPI0013593397|nr:acyltransferase [Methylosinus sp. Ce-a6]